MPLVLDRDPRRRRFRARASDAPSSARVAEPPLVVRVRGERAELGPQPPGLGEEQPALGPNGHVLPEQMLEHGAPRALRVRALRDLRQLVRVAEQDERPSRGPRPRARRRARADPPRRRRARRSAAPPRGGRPPRGSAQPVPATRSNDGSAQTSASLDETMQRLSNAVSDLSSSRARLTPRKANPCRVGLVLDRAQQVVDRLVAERGDAHPLPGVHERDRHPRALPGLARAGRPLDEEVALARATAPPRPGRRRAARRARAARGARSAPGSARGHRPRTRATKRSSASRLTQSLDRLARGQPVAAAARPRASMPRSSVTTPASSSTRETEPLASSRAEPLAVELVLLRGEGHPVRVALVLDLGRPPVPREAADRGAILDELLIVELRPAKPRPPPGTLLALVVVDEVTEQAPRRRPPPLPRAAGLGAPPARRRAPRPPRSAACARRAARATAARGGRSSRAATRAARPSSGSPPRCSARRRRAARRPRLQPLLEADDRLVPARDLRGAHEPVELLDRLDRVAVDRGAERLLDDAVEVDEHLPAQEVVDLLLARPVLAHQPRERGALVGGVVVDVHPRVAAAPLDDPVDELLERARARRRGRVAQSASVDDLAGSSR